MEPQSTQLETTVLKALTLMGLGEDLRYEKERKHISLIIEDTFVNDKNLPLLVGDFNHIVQLFAKKYDEAPLYVDVNNYQKKRENLIIEIARAAAKKAAITKQVITLPAMNSYERRLVHVELAMHPDVKTESVGDSKARAVEIRPVAEGEAAK